MPKRIAIFGAGVGGLSLAHRMIKSGHVVDVYELKDRAGGLARSEGDSCHTREISWRVYFDFYDNVRRLMDEIPDGSGQNVSDHLIPYNARTPGLNISMKDALVYARNIAQIVCASDARLDEWDKDTWHDSVDVNACVPQWLGLDKFKASYEAVAKIGIEQSLMRQFANDHVLDGPTNVVWIDPWVEFLRQSGVRFHFNTPVASVAEDGARLADGTAVDADIYVLSVPVEVLAQVTTLVPDATKLASAARQIQLAFQLHLSEPLSFGKARDGSPCISVLLEKSPWALIVEDKAVSWSVPCAPWSVTVCQANVAGTLIGKPLVRCTAEEAFNEIVHQMMTEGPFVEMLQRENPGFSGIHVREWRTMDDTYIFSPDGMTTTEPKFSNNAGTLALRPSYRVAPNVYISTAYVKETVDIFSMEAAALAAEFVTADINETAAPRLPDRPLPILAPVRWADSVLHRARAPHVLVVMILLIAVFVVRWYVR